MRKKIAAGSVFAVLIALGAATAAFTAGAAPFGAQATTTIVSTVITGSSTVVTTITTTTPDSTSTGSTTGSTSTGTTPTAPTAGKITICHHARGKNGAVKHVTIRISRSAWKAHQKHGDSIGACSTAAARKFHSKPAHIKKFHGKKKNKK